MKTSADIGRALETRVARVLQWEGWRPVRRNVRVRDSHGHWSELDVVAGRWWRKLYVECKAYAPDRPVPLEDVAKFREVLRLLGVPPGRGLFVTTSSFSPRALTVGVRTVDGAAFLVWEARARRWRWLRAARRVALVGTTAALVALVAAGAVLASDPAAQAAAAQAVGDGAVHACLATHAAATHAWRQGVAGAVWAVDQVRA
jgi:hypothetical protein